MLNKPRLFLFGIPILALVALGLGAFYQYSRYRENGLDGLQTRPRPSVAITNPQPLSQVSVHAPVIVHVSAHAYSPIKTVELWVNGQRMGKQAAPDKLTALDAEFAWNPGTPGQYTLVARVSDDNGDTADSSPVPLEITAYTPPEGTRTDKPSDDSVAAVIPAADTGKGGVSGPGDAPVPPAAPGGELSATDWLTHLTSQTAPNAPELALAVQGCSVKLQIHDLSNNEEGFQVFRALGDGSGWQQIASLGSQSQSPWIGYDDTLTGGQQASYYVVAVNGAGQAESNLATTETDPAACAPAAGQQHLLIHLKSFDTGGSADQAYCYRSLDNVHWERWPANGFLRSGKPFDPSSVDLSFALDGLEGRAGLKKLQLTLECWGWAGGGLKYLGKVNFSDLDLSGLGLHSADDGSLHIVFDLGGDDKVPYKYTLPPKTVNLPFITAWLTYDPQVCKNHLPANAQNDFGMFLFCTPYPGYTIGANTSNPQPYLVWTTLDHTCQAGFNDDCIPYATLLDLAKQKGGKVGFLLHQSDKNNGYWYGLPGVPTEYVVPMQNCPSDLTMSLQITYQTAQYFVSGPESNEVKIPCKQPYGDSVPINVTFESITLSNVKDGESDPEDVELYGSFHASTNSGFSEYRTLGDWNYLERDSNGCPNEDFFQGFNTNGIGGLGCLDSYQNGTTSLADEEMCASDSLGYCYFSASDTTTDFKTNNNTIKVMVSDGDSIFLDVQVYDYDSASSDDLTCMSTSFTVSRTLFQWASVAPQTINLSSPDFGGGACSIKVKIGGAP